MCQGLRRLEQAVDTLLQSQGLILVRATECGKFVYSLFPVLRVGFHQWEPHLLLDKVTPNVITLIAYLSLWGIALF